MKWKFSGEKNDSTPLDTTGMEWTNFAVDKADGQKVSYKASSDKFTVSNGLGDLIEFDSAVDSVIVSLDNHELALDDADGEWKAKDGKFNYKGVLDGVTSIQFVLDISGQTASWKFKLAKDDFWDEVDGSDGIDLRIIAGDYEGGLRLGADQVTTLTFPKK